MRRTALLLFLLFNPLLPVHMGYAQCGIVPIKPIPPIGCKDLKPQCVCAINPRTGANECHWEWICVR